MAGNLQSPRFVLCTIVSPFDWHLAFDYLLSGGHVDVHSLGRSGQTAVVQSQNWDVEVGGVACQKDVK